MFGLTYFSLSADINTYEIVEIIYVNGL